MMQHILGKAKLRQILSVFLVLSLLLGSFQSIAYADDPISVEIGTASGAPGDTVDVAVSIDPGDEDVLQYEMTLSYDVNVLEPVSTNPITTNLDSFEFNPNVTREYGMISVIAGYFPPYLNVLDGKQEVFVIHFKIKETAVSTVSQVILNLLKYTGDDEDWNSTSNSTPGTVTVTKPETVSVEIGTASGFPGEAVDVPVSIQQSSGSAGAYGMQIDFEPTALQVQSITGLSGEFFDSNHDNEEGWLKVAWTDKAGGDNGVAAQDELFTVKFKIKDSATEGEKELTISNQSDAQHLTFTDTKLDEMDKTVIAGKVTVKPAPTEAQAPIISAQPDDSIVYVGDSSPKLSATAAVSDGGNLTYQWFKNTESSDIGWEAVSGATTNTYDAPATEAGTLYYYVEVKNTLGTLTKITSSTIASVVVNPAPAAGTWIDITGPERPVNGPVDVAVDHNGTVYVANHSTIKKRLSNGNWQNITPSAGTGNIQGIAADSNGNVYMASAYDRYIKKYTNNEWQIMNFDGLGNPSDVAVDSQGNVYATDFQGHTVKKLVGDTWQSLSDSYIDAVSLAVGNDGTVYALDADFQVKKLSDGSWEDITTGLTFHTPRGIAVDGSGNVYVTDSYSSVRKLTGTTWNDITKEGDFVIPSGIAVDSKGTVYVSDSESNKIKKQFAQAQVAMPLITAQPIGKNVNQNDPSPRLSVTATISDGGTLTYQWYKNTAYSDIGWEPINGATASTYDAPATEAGTLYYYVAVTNTLGTLSKTKASAIAMVTVSGGNAESPNITEDPKDATVYVGQTKPRLSVTAEVSDGGTLSYQWYQNTSFNEEGWEAISGATESYYDAPTTKAGKTYYFVEVTNTLGTVIAPNNSSVATVTVNEGYASSPSITAQPKDATVNVNDPSPRLSVEAEVMEGGSLSYQWYSNTKKSVESGNLIKIAGATSSSYDVPTSTAGTTYYFVEVKNTVGSQTNMNLSEIATVVVNPVTEPATGSWIDITGPEKPVFGPIDVAVDNNGTVYVANSNSVKKQSANGSWIDITPEGASFISGMAADSSGAIYVSRSRSSTILKYSEGTWEIIDAEGLSTPVDVAFSANDQIFVADKEFNAISTLFGGFWGSITEYSVYPVGLAVGGETIYVTETDNSVRKLGYGSWEDITAGVTFNSPKGIAADANGNVYVADSNNQVVRKLSGGVWTTISTQEDFIGPHGVAIDRNGTVYVSDNESGRIKKLVANAEVPVISTQPSGKTVDQGSESPILSVTAAVYDGTLSYQWFSSTMNSTDTGLAIDGATESTYSVPTTQAGTLYYYVVVKNTNQAAVQNKTASVISEIASVTVNAVQLPAYSVTFDRQDGSAPASMGVTQGSKVPNIIVTARPGYTFEGWYKDAAGTTKWNMDTDVVTGDVTLYAKWTAVNSGGNNGGDNGGNSGGNNGGSTGGTTAPANDAVIVLVNGKEEKIGKSAASAEGERTVTTITVDQQQLEAKLEAEGQGAVVTIPVSADSDIIVGELNGQMIKNMEDKQAVLVVKTGNASYTLPALQLDIDSISKQLGSTVALEDIKVQIRIAAPEAAMVKVAADAAEQNALTLVAPSIDFTVKATHAGKAVDVTKFNVYVERSIALPEGIDPNKITTGIVTEPDGPVRHVPTKITVESGKYHAQINSLNNSLYSVVWHPLTFKDVEGHWAKDSVNDMGSRLVVNGVGNDLYNPDEDMTRAEFAAIMMRGLGLKPVDGKSAFADVKASDWYYSAVLTAYDYKLIEGFEDGSFRPQEKITREQAMLILSKAMAITGLQEKLAAKDSYELLKPYADAANVSDWAKAGVAASLEAGVVSGRGADELAPKANITRAEVAAIVQRILKASDLIN
jgi:uncharacterized repeat protein (TIGR02543 family)